MTFSRPILVGLVGSLVLVAGVVAYFVMDSKKVDPAAILIEPTDGKLVALGETVYAKECAACHGVKLKGQANWRTRRPDGKLPAPPHDETGHTWHHPDMQLFILTKEGVAALTEPGYKTDMPGFKDRLSDHEIRASLAYIKSRWPENILKRQMEISRRALEVEHK